MKKIKKERKKEKNWKKLEKKRHEEEREKKKKEREKRTHLWLLSCYKSLSWVPLIVFYYQIAIKLITQTSKNTKIFFFFHPNSNFWVFEWNNHPKLSQTLCHLWAPLVLDDGSWKLSDITQFSCYPNKL